MRSVFRRSFTVQIKASGRGSATIIPSRIASLHVPSPRPFFGAAFETPAPAPEKRRILPNLIVPEAAELELVPVGEAVPHPRRRGRPPKPRSVPAEPMAAVVAPVIAPRSVPAAEAREHQPAPAPTRTKRLMRPTPAPAPGERWKRRFGKWSR